MLDQNTLEELKSKMPRGYTTKVVKAFNELNNSTVSTKTIYRFFEGKSYSQELHAAILSVAEAQVAINIRTKQIIDTANV